MMIRLGIHRYRYCVIISPPSKGAAWYIVSEDDWHRDRHGRLYKIASYGKFGRDELDFIQRSLMKFSYKQLWVLAKECENNPDLLQKVVKTYEKSLLGSIAVDPSQTAYYTPTTSNTGYGKIVWHSGNDGSESGLDIDLLDGN